MRILAPPGVFRPISDSRLLASCLREELPPGGSVADICCGSGYLAVSAALHGAGEVAAVDVSRRAVLTTRLNALINGVRVSAHRGDLFAPLGGRRFDLIVSNPPYVPSAESELPARGLERAWEAGEDGRAILERIEEQASAHLKPGGAVLVVQSSVIDPELTLERLQAKGLQTDVLVRRRGGLGPLLSARTGLLRERGLLPDGCLEEEIVVIRGRYHPRSGPLAQLVEQETLNLKVEGSSPSWPTPELASRE